MVAARLGARVREYSQTEDIAQTVCMGLMASLSSLENRTVAGFKSFLSTIVSRRVADHLRRPGTQHVGDERVASLESTAAGSSGPGPLWQFLSATGTSPASAAERTDQFARVLSELEELKPAYRDAITYAFFDHLSTAEIGSRLGISRPAASMLLIRALQALRRRLVPAAPVESGK